MRVCFVYVLGVLNMVDSKLMKRDRPNRAVHDVNLLLLSDFRQTKHETGICHEQIVIVHAVSVVTVTSCFQVVTGQDRKFYLFNN